MDGLPANATDLAIAGIVLVSALLAFFRGFVREMLAVGAWVGAIFATLYGFPYARPIAHKLIPVEILADGAAGIVIFVVTLALLSLVSHALSRTIQGSALSAVDRSLGFLFGVLRGVVLVCLAYLVIEWAVPRAEQPAWLREARAMPLVEQGAGLLMRLVPRDARERSAQAAEDARRKAEQARELERAYRQLTTPPPKADAARPPSDYTVKDTQEMDRLIRGTQ